MPAHSSDANEFMPAAPAPIKELAQGEDIENVKRTMEHLEDASYAEQKAIQDVEDQYHGGDDTAPRTGWRKLFRSNPSTEFMKEVAEANTQPLDPAEVKRVSGIPCLHNSFADFAQVERKIYWLIVPALAVDYAFYYIDKTTLQYAALFGIKGDLSLSGTDYSNLGSIFYMYGASTSSV
jgi:hypothetical protein